jgi:helix-turn-helix protein
MVRFLQSLFFIISKHKNIQYKIKNLYNFQNACTGVGKSRFTVLSTRNTEFVLVLLLILLFIIYLYYLYYYYYYYYFVSLLMIYLF